jgi:peptidoglycan hydrolase-like protein with peptidoglycan-binding domain
MGSQGADVAGLQQSLNDLGADPRQPQQRSTQPALVPDGIFGARTRARVIEFQLKNGLSPDGIVGPITLGRIFALGGFVPESAPGAAPAGAGGGKAGAGTSGFGGGRTAGTLAPSGATRLIQGGMAGAGSGAGGGTHGRGSGGGRIA